MQSLLELLGEKVVSVFRYGGCSVTSGWTLVKSESTHCSFFRVRGVQSVSFTSPSFVGMNLMVFHITASY
jgi:hypothetical protein